MIVLYSTRLLRVLTPWFSGITGITLFPFIILRSELQGAVESAVTINHEKIHIRQQLELLLVFFALWYFASFIAGLARGRGWYGAYRNIIFEREAFDRMYELDYLARRRPFGFLKFRNNKVL
jgi:hypothetical protein